MEKLKRWILHPFLFGAYPVIALLAYNIKQIGPMFAFRPVLIALLLATIFWLCFRLILRDWQKAAIATTLSLLLFFSYGHIHSLLQYVNGIAILGKNRYLAMLWAGLFAVGIWLIINKIRSAQVWTLSLNTVGILLLSFSLLQIAFYEVNYLRTVKQLRAAGSSSIAGQLHLQPGKTPPDIYYIIPEDYTRSDGLKKVFGYDNSGFLTGLEQRGFFVATCSQANYSTSDASIASSMNMNYLDQLNSQFSPPNANLNELYPFIQDNAVRQTLKDLGYKFVAFESGYTPTEFRDADIYLSPQADIQNLHILGGLTAFEAMLFQTTVGSFFYATPLIPGGLRNTLFDNAYLLHRNRILYELDKLPQVTSIPGPKFVFVHIIAPHNPFVFGPNGEILHRTTPFTLNNDVDAMDPKNYTAGYDGQVNYLDTRILEDVIEILEKSSTPPIILIQSDDGSSRAGEWDLANLNAYYLPSGGESYLYPSISPVNSFRVIFNAYFGGNLGILPDRACDSTRSDPYGCITKVDPDPVCVKAKTP